MTIIFFAVVFIWLLVVTAILLKTRQHYRNLTRATHRQKLDEILDKIISDNTNVQLRIKSVENILNQILNENQNFFRKVNIVRYNPFEKDSGDNSFIIAMLNNKNNGIVLNFIYTRDGIRVYAKKVKEVKGDDYPLSTEEKKAISMN